jgi:SAM-dependent methyltransferase
MPDPNAKDESQRLTDAARLLAEPLAGVDQNVSPAERMWGANEESRERAHYFAVGQSALDCIRHALLDAGKTEVRRVLDLPCGHGRVMRAIRAAWPQAEITGCDLLRDGVDYCVQAFGAKGVYSQPCPDLSIFDSRFDLIFCGSLLTHLPPVRWAEFISLFRNLLEPHGVIVVSVQGSFVAHRMRTDYQYGLSTEQISRIIEDYEQTGFGYVCGADGGEYGTTLCRPWWAVKQFNQYSDLRVMHYREQVWDNHHDVIACVRRNF